MYPIRKRYGEEEWDIRQFVQPMTPGVVRLASSLPQDRFVEAAWEWVVNNIKYPYGNVEIADRHYQEAFLGPTFRRAITFDYWSFPAETLATGVGDCEDASNLLVSILRHRLTPQEVFVTVGHFDGMGHAWVTIGRNLLVLEATPPNFPTKYVAAPEAPPYNAILRYNDVMVIGDSKVLIGWRAGPPGIKSAAIARHYSRLTAQRKRIYA